MQGVQAPCILSSFMGGRRGMERMQKDLEQTQTSFAKCYVKLSFVTKSTLYLAGNHKSTNFAAELLVLCNGNKSIARNLATGRQ